MKTTVSLTLLISLMLAGCSSAVSSTAKPKETMPSASASANSGETQIPTAEGTNSSQQKPSFSKIKGPPAILLMQTPALLKDQKEFTSATFHVAVNYPSSWSMKEQADGATFTSPADAVISLQASTPSGANAGNQQCKTLITDYDQRANLCVNAGTYSAEFNLQFADGSSESLIISTTNEDALDVYQEMINSLHPNQ